MLHPDQLRWLVRRKFTLKAGQNIINGITANVDIDRMHPGPSSGDLQPAGKHEEQDDMQPCRPPAFDSRCQIPAGEYQLSPIVGSDSHEDAGESPEQALTSGLCGGCFGCDCPMAQM